MTPRPLSRPTHRAGRSKVHGAGVAGVFLALTLPVQAEITKGLRHGPMIKPWSHVSNHQESKRTDCSTDSLGGIGWWASKNGWEIEGTIGTRRIRCGLRRDTGPGATFEIAKKWEWRGK